jgi:hypothetical protein
MLHVAAIDADINEHWCAKVLGLFYRSVEPELAVEVLQVALAYGTFFFLRHDNLNENQVF